MNNLPVKRKKGNSCNAGYTWEPACDDVGQLGLLFCHGLPSLGLSSSDVSTCFSSGKRETVAPVAGRVFGSPRAGTDEDRPRKESASQQKMEANIRISNKESE